MVKKILLGVILAVLLSLPANSILADSANSITGGGILFEGQGKDIQKITFGVNVFINESGQPSGHLQVNFYNVLYDDFDKGKFKSSYVDEVWTSINTLDDEGYFFAGVRFIGQFNGEEGWSIIIRMSDFGEPGRAKPDTGNHWDAVRISVFNPMGEPIWDTAWEDTTGFPHEQSWRTLLDGGNIKVHF